MTIVFESYTLNSGTFALRRHPRMRMSDSSSAFLLHRSPTLAMTGTSVTHLPMLLSRPAPQLRMSDHSTLFLLQRVKQLAMADAAPAPTSAIFILNAPPHRLAMTATITTHATMALHRQPGLLMAGADARLLLHRVPRLYLSDGHVSMDRMALLVQQPEIYAHSVLGITEVIVDAMALGASGIAQQVMVRMAALVLHTGPVTSLLDGLSQISETIGFDEVAFAVWQILHAEALTLHGVDTVSTSTLIQVAEALALLGGSGSQLHALNAVVTALKVGASRGYVWPVSAAEHLGASGTPVDTLLALERQTEMLKLGATSVGYATISMLVPETLALDETLTSTAHLLNQINEGMELLVRISLPDGEYLAWVCNTESRAFTSYRNFPFNSFAEIDGHYYGATDTGIYLLEGDTDAGEPIAARLRSGLSDMGTGKLKRMESLYLGYRSSGSLVLKVITTSDGGEKTESWYSLESRPASDMRENRVKIGKGLKSLYWGYEIANVNGADFALDKLSFLPLVLERKL